MNGVTHPLIQSDVSLELMGTSIDNIPKMFVVNFKGRYKFKKFSIIS